MKRLKYILTILTCLLFAWALFSVYSVYSTEDSWITYGIHAGFSLYLGMITLCLTILLYAQNKIQVGAWLFGIFLIGIAFYLLFQPTGIVDYWNYALGGLVILIGYALIQLSGGKRVMWLIVSPVVLLMSIIFFLKFNYAFTFTFGTVYLSLLSIISVSVLLFRR